jgi:hypothetical protein
LVYDVVDAWRQLDELDASREFLVEHEKELTTPEAFDALARRGEQVRWALAVLAGSAWMERAYRLLKSPDEATAALEDARRELSPLAMRALASLAATVAETSEDRALARVHVGIALALSGERADAGEAIGALASDDVLIQAVSDAIVHHADQAPALAAPIGQLTAAT